MVTLILRDNATQENVLTIRTSAPLLPSDEGIPFEVVEFEDIPSLIAADPEATLVPALKDLNYNLNKGVQYTLASLRVITDRNELTIFTEDGMSIEGEFPTTTTTTTEDPG